MKKPPSFNLIDFAGPVLAILAGIYLLQWESAGAEANWFETFARGVGIYFIGKGLFMLRALYRSSLEADYLARLVELGEGKTARRDAE